MSEAVRRWDGEQRQPWPWWKRSPVRLADWFYRFYLAPFMTKVGTNGDSIIMGSMTRWAVCLFTIAMTLRLAPLWVKTSGGWVATMAPLSPWDDIAIFLILYALGIDKAINNAKPKEVLELVGRALPGPAASQSVTTADGTTLTQTAAPAVPPAPIPAVPTEEYDGPPPGGGA